MRPCTPFVLSVPSLLKMFVIAFGGKLWHISIYTLFLTTTRIILILFFPDVGFVCGLLFAGFNLLTYLYF